MVSKKSSHAAVSQVSSSAAPATASSTLSATSSSILRCAFSPSTYQLSLFASVIQGLDSQHLRIHDTDTGRLRCEHTVASKTTISCLDWGCHSSKHQDGHEHSSKKKRKRSEPANGLNGQDDNSDLCVAFGTSGSDSRISMFSPHEGRIVRELKGVQSEHARGVRDFKFTSGRAVAEGWSLGNGDGKLVQWDLQIGSRLRRVLWRYQCKLSYAVRLTLLKSHIRNICSLRHIEPTCTYRLTSHMCIAHCIHHSPRIERLEPVFSFPSLYKRGTHPHNVFAKLARVVSAILNGLRIGPLHERIRCERGRTCRITCRAE